MTNAAITPGTQPIQVSISTMSTEPQPLSITDKGGNIMASMTLSSDMLFFCKDKYLKWKQVQNEEKTLSTKTTKHFA